MNRTRYIDRKVLCDYDLREEFFENLGVKIQDMIPLRKVFIIFTEKGKKILKLTDLEESKVRFIDKSLRYIENNNKNILKYCENKDGEVITRWDGKKFVLLEMIDGREASFTNPIEIELCAKAIGRYHLATDSIKDIFTEEEIKMNSGGNLIDEFNKNLIIINEIERLVNKFKYKNKFDSMFLLNVEKAKDDIIKSINYLTNTKYEEIYSNGKKILCHNDLAHHNFILDNDIVNIVDFDYCKLDIRVVDIYNFTVKVLKSFAYNEEIIKLIINSYNEISILNHDEIEILYSLISYPRDFVNISKDYYLKQKPWDEDVFIGRFENKIELDCFRTELVEQLKNNN